VSTNFDTDKRESLIQALRDKEYRDLFVAELIDTGVPFQIRAMRESRGWTQAQLAEAAEMAQPRIAVLEDPNYGRLVNTLKRIASAFDVALIVRFVPYSMLVDLELQLSPDTLNPPSFADDILLAATQTTPTVGDTGVSADMLIPRFEVEFKEIVFLRDSVFTKVPKSEGTK
jgi:transcriptional regulator with XRE-family HTH domain